jgi:hypothetical protein
MGRIIAPQHPVHPIKKAENQCTYTSKANQIYGQLDFTIRAANGNPKVTTAQESQQPKGLLT